jgi:methylmalonyl-CoA mutase
MQSSLKNTISPMAQELFSEFPKITKEAWLGQVIKDLKGKNFAETLVWQSLEGFDISPYYNEEDLKNVPTKAIQAAQESKNTIIWQNKILIEYSSPKATNILIINTLNSGADEIIIDFKDSSINEHDLVRLLNNIKLSETPIYFKTLFPEVLMNNLKKIVHYQPKGGFVNDSLSNYFLSEYAAINHDTWESTKNLLIQCNEFPAFRPISIASHSFHNAGANAVQELAFTLASAVTYLDQLTNLELTIEEIVPKIEFSISIGTNYFVEIAKLRALRYLWTKIGEGYNSTIFTKNCVIHGQTSSFYDSTLSPYTNMLRATTEAMSATMGGCDSLTVLAYDSVLGSDLQSDLGERIAKNVSILMKEEALLDKTQDPAAGSYYIESLTYQLVNVAWKLFLKVEQKGGILNAFEQGFIQSEIEKAYNAKVESLKNGKIMVGVNKFRVEPENIEKTDKSIVSNENILQNRRVSEVYE